MSVKKYGDEKTAVQLLKEILSRAQTERGRSYGINFKPRSNDVFVVTYLNVIQQLQQILHQFRSGGDMTFEDICDVAPYIELSYDVKIDIEADHEFKPR